MATPGAELHVPRPRGDRRGRPDGVPQAHHPAGEQQGARGRAVHGAERGDQHHRRPGLGRGPVRVRPGMGDERAGDRQHHRPDAVPGHRDLADRGQAADHAATTGCSTFSTRCCRPGCRLTASTGNWFDPGGACAQAPGGRGAGQDQRHHRPAAAARPDQLRRG